MAYDWKQWYGVGQDAYNKEKQRITNQITAYGAKGDLASIQKAQKHQAMFEQAYKGIDPNTGKSFSSSQLAAPSIGPRDLFGDISNSPLVQSYLGSGGIDQDSLLKSARKSVQGQLDILNSQNQTMSNRAQQQLDRGIGIVDADVSRAQEKLEKTSFLDRMRAKESLVASGNADSSAGLADMDTRVNLAKQENLSDISFDASRQKENLTNSYNLTLQELQDRLSSFDVEGKTNEVYQQLYKNALDDNKQQQDMIWNVLSMQNDNNKALLPYYFQDAGDQAKNAIEQQKLGFDVFKFGNLSAKDQQDLLLDYYKFDNPSGDAKLNANTELYKWANPSANSVLDANVDMQQWNNPSANAMLQAQAQIQAANIRAAASENGGTGDLLKALTLYGNTQDPSVRSALEAQYPFLSQMNQNALASEVGLAMDGISPSTHTVDEAISVIKGMPNLTAAEKTKIIQGVRNEWAIASKSGVNKPKTVVQDALDGNDTIDGIKSAVGTVIQNGSTLLDVFKNVFGNVQGFLQGK